MDVSFAPIGEAEARQIAGWQYDGPYASYNCPAGDVDGFVRVMIDPGNRYFAARDGGGELVGYCCFGPDARVPGGRYDDAVLDVGLGLRPNLTGRGFGPDFVEAIVAFAGEAMSGQRLGMVVAAWNRRAIRAYEKAGFRGMQTFTHDTPGGRANGSIEWGQMMRDGCPRR